MTILYVPVLSLERAEELSTIFWKLTNPPLDRKTKAYSSPIIHPSTGEVRLPIDGENFYIHSEADKHLLDDYLAFFIQYGYISTQELTFIQNLIEVSRGTSVNLQLCLPEIWRLQLVDIQYLQDNGWFDEPLLEEENLPPT